MKKIFRLSAIVAMLSMMATTSVVTSCSDDDDDTTAAPAQVTDWSTAATKVTATPGATYALKNANVEYSLKVISAKAGEVVVSLNSGADVTLSDAGTSYLSTAGAGMYKADAEADGSKVLVCLLSGTTTLASATEGANTVIANTANKTLIK